MKINNETDWNTFDLKRLINETAKKVGIENNRIIKVVYNNSDNSNCSGLATIGGRWVKMRVPRKEFDSCLFASVLEHEFHHNLGLRHDEMGSLDKCEWAKEFQVRKKDPPKPKEKEPLIQRRYKHAKKMMEQKQEILRRNQKLLNKWRKKVKYYEKKLGKG